MENVVGEVEEAQEGLPIKTKETVVITKIKLKNQLEKVAVAVVIDEVVVTEAAVIEAVVIEAVVIEAVVVVKEEGINSKAIVVVEILTM